MIQFILECILQIFGELVIEYFFTKYKKWTWWLWGLSSIISGVFLVHYEPVWWQVLVFSPIIGLFVSILLLLPVYLGIKLTANKTKKKKAKKY